jgi:flavin reductase (DIM6/NTAB) family NADH-FMN oxidoreductase RutF
MATTSRTVETIQLCRCVHQRFQSSEPTWRVSGNRQMQRTPQIRTPQIREPRSIDHGRMVDVSGTFADFVGLLDYPMFVVTTRAAGRNAGCLVGFATQSSIDPPTFLVGISRLNHTFSVAREATHLVVHVLAREQLGLARLFGAETGETVDKFERCQWHSGPEGLPILDAATAWFVGLIGRRFDMGDHVGQLLTPIAVGGPVGSAAVMSYADVKELKPGHDA